MEISLHNWALILLDCLLLISSNRYDTSLKSLKLLSLRFDYICGDVDGRLKQR